MDKNIVIDKLASLIINLKEFDNENKQRGKRKVFTIEGVIYLLEKLIWYIEEKVDVD